MRSDSIEIEGAAGDVKRAEQVFADFVYLKGCGHNFNNGDLASMIRVLAGDPQALCLAAALCLWQALAAGAWPEVRRALFVVGIGVGPPESLVVRTLRVGGNEAPDGEGVPDAFVQERIALHTASEPRPCTDADRWVKPSKYAVMKRGNVRAIRLFDTAYEAEELASTSAALYVEYRPGEAVRCQNWCPVSRWCKQWAADPRNTQPTPSITETLFDAKV